MTDRIAFQPRSSLHLIRRAAVAIGMVVLSAREARAAFSITNTGSVIAQNEANMAQAPVTALVVFMKKENPVLAVVKTSDLVTGAPGQRVEYSLALTYPLLGPGACGQNSNAVNVTLTDTIPAGMTYVANSSSVSVDSGATFGLGTDAADGTDVAGIADVTFVAGQVRVTFVNPIVECTTGGTTRVVKFAVTVN